MDESAGEPLILDESILVDLEQRLGRDRVASFTHMLRAELDEVLDILSSPATSWETIASQAHSMVSLAGNLGCMELMTRSRELMNALRGGAKEAADLVTAMSSALGRADAALAERYPEGVAADA